MQTVEMTRIFHALSDDTRLEIVRRLSSGEKCVCDLQDLLDAAQSRLSYHLKTLKEAGIVTDRKQGRWVYYTLAAEPFELLREFAGGVEERAPWDPAPGCC